MYVLIAKLKPSLNKTDYRKVKFFLNKFIKYGFNRIDKTTFVLENCIQLEYEHQTEIYEILNLIKNKYSFCFEFLIYHNKCIEEVIINNIGINPDNVLVIDAWLKEDLDKKKYIKVKKVLDMYEQLDIIKLNKDRYIYYIPTKIHLSLEEDCFKKTTEITGFLKMSFFYNELKTKFKHCFDELIFYDFINEKYDYAVITAE